MAIRQREAPTTITAGDHIYEATADTAVTSIHMCNITSSNATINIYLLPEDGSTTAPTEENKIYNTLTISATDSYVIDTEKMILGNGDKIYVQKYIGFFFL